MQKPFASSPSAFALCKLLNWGDYLPPLGRNLSGLVGYLLTLVIIYGCTGNPIPTPVPAPTPGGELSGGLLLTFEVDGEMFHVWVTNPNTIDDLKPLERGFSVAPVPTGSILPGSGLGDHNAPWSWHFDPSDFRMSEKASSECDKRPSYVEQNLEEMIAAIGYYCPSDAMLRVITEYP